MGKLHYCTQRKFPPFPSHFILQLSSVFRVSPGLCVRFSLSFFFLYGLFAYIFLLCVFLSLCVLLYCLVIVVFVFISVCYYSVFMSLFAPFSAVYLHLLFLSICLPVTPMCSFVCGSLRLSTFVCWCAHVFFCLMLFCLYPKENIY